MPISNKAQATLISEKVIVIDVLGIETTYFTEIDPIQLKGGEIKVSKDGFNLIRSIFKLYNI